MQSYCASYSLALFRAGHKADARDEAEKAGAMPESDWGTYTLACYHAVVGDRSRALHYLHRYLELGPSEEDLLKEPNLSSLHGDSEFEAVAAEAKKRHRKATPSRREEQSSPNAWRYSAKPPS